MTNKICKYCIEVDTGFATGKYLMYGKVDVIINEDCELSVLGNDFSKYKKIKYCPMCGRKLEKKKET